MFQASIYVQHYVNFSTVRFKIFVEIICSGYICRYLRFGDCFSLFSVQPLSKAIFKVHRCGPCY